MAPASSSSTTAQRAAIVSTRGRALVRLLRHGSEEASIESAALRGRADRPIVAPDLGVIRAYRPARQEDDRGVAYRDRRDAGQQLAARLTALPLERPVVVALPRGGVPVGLEVARALGAPLELLAVRKLGAPGNPELAVGAVAEDGTGVFDARSAGLLGMTQDMLDAAVARESRELQRRVERYRGGRLPLAVNRRAAIVVDDGIATGMTELAAVRALRKSEAGSIVVAVPVGSEEAVAMLEAEADRVICLRVPARLYGVGMWYEDFRPVSDDEVLALLAEAPREHPAGDEPGVSQPPDGDNRRAADAS
jgi:putative phosphoribosyl transferase